MNNETAREILSAYRPNGSDANDPRFAEPLQRCQHDPELNRWLDSERHFDQRVAATLQGVAIPPAARQSLIATADVEEQNVVPFYSRPWTWVAVAASLALMLGAALWRTPEASVGIGPLPVLAAAQPAAELVSWLDGLRSLDFHAENPRTVLSWLTDEFAPVPTTLPAGLEDGMVNGCKVFLNGRGKPVSLICFMSRGQVVHFFTWDLDTTQPAVTKGPLMFAQGRWNGAGWAEGTQGHALVGRVSPDEIEELVATSPVTTL